MQILKPDYVATPTGIHADWCVTVDRGIIVDVGPAARHPENVQRLPGRIVLPGLVNAHSHAFQRAIRGRVQLMGEPQDDFWSWRTAMYGVANSLDPDGVRAVSRLAFLEMALAGVTAVGEFHYLHHTPDGRPYNDPDELARQVIAAALDVGVRICLLRVVYERKSATEPLATNQQRFGDARVDDALDAIARLSQLDDPRVGVGLAPHSVRAVSAPWLAELADATVPIHVHVAEQRLEVQQCFAENGCSPLAVLGRAGLLSERFSAVHLTWPSDGDLALLAATKGTVCLCPTTEMDLGDGFFPAHQWRGYTSVGSDSHARIDVLEEARLVEGFARAQAGRRGISGSRPASRVLDTATAHGARSLLLSSGIVAGNPADLFAVDLRAPRFEGVAPLEAAMFGADSQHISDVWVAGAQIVKDGRHAQQEAIVRSARQVLLSVG